MVGGSSLSPSLPLSFSYIHLYYWSPLFFIGISYTELDKIKQWYFKFKSHFISIQSNRHKKFSLFPCRQSATDQNVVPLLPVRKNLDGSQGTLCWQALRAHIQSLNITWRNCQLHQREALHQRRNKRALQLPKTSVNFLTFQTKLKSSSLQSQPLTLDQGG